VITELRFPIVCRLGLIGKSKGEEANRGLKAFGAQAEISEEQPLVRLDRSVAGQDRRQAAFQLQVQPALEELLEGEGVEKGSGRQENEAALRGIAGFLKTPLHQQRLAQRSIGLGILGVQLDSLSVVGNGLLQSPLCLQGEAEVVVGLNELGIEVEGSAI
jgi:hypothetical protein